MTTDHGTTRALCGECETESEEQRMSDRLTTDENDAQVVLGQVGEHVEPRPCRECGKSASACGRSRHFCCAACSQSRFNTHHDTPTLPVERSH